MALPEQTVLDTIKIHVQSTSRSFIYKVAGSGLSGVALDIVGSYRGRPFWIEVKAPGKHPSMIQLALITRNRACGYVSGYVTSLSDFIALFDKD